jgi:hypothetical protein
MPLEAIREINTGIQKSNETIGRCLPNNMKENIRQGESPTPFHSIGL